MVNGKRKCMSPWILEHDRAELLIAIRNSNHGMDYEN